MAIAFSLSLPFPLSTKLTSKKTRGSHFPVRFNNGSSELSPLYDDGFGSKSIKDYFDAARELIKAGDGPPRWFCPVECGPPVSGSPVLMFLPDIDGTGMGLIMHHKSLGKVFEVRCLHIPMSDRTPFEGLVKFVEQSVKHEHALSPNRPIYLLGDSFGGCIALSVAARNPYIDLVLVLVNPATSYNESKLQPLIPALEALPDEIYTGIPYVLSLITGDPLKMAASNIAVHLPPQQTLLELSQSVSSFLPLLSDLADTIRKDTLLWKLKILKNGSSYTNSRLHAVEAQVLVIASGNDNLLPSRDEAVRLWTSLKTCKVRHFKDNSHSILLEDRINLLTVIKGTRTYRHSQHYDFVTDHLPPTIHEFKSGVQTYGFLQKLISPVFLSTLENGKIVRGLSGIPDNGPVLFVGYHSLMGFEVFSFIEEFLREKNVVVHGLAQPYMATKPETPLQEYELFDDLVVFGGLPVSAKNIYKLFSSKSFVLLFPGGLREAYHRKGEEYKLFWPDQPEFVRMAARFGATIVPFGVAGEDDMMEIFMDYNDQMKFPFIRKWIEELNNEPGRIKLRANMDGEISKQDVHYPLIAPKVPGRFYYLFGKPYKTWGIDSKNQEAINELYLRVKSDVESLILYLRKKREEDPYRSIVQRTMYQNSRGTDCEIPTFEL